MKNSTKIILATVIALAVYQQFFSSGTPSQAPAKPAQSPQASFPVAKLTAYGENGILNNWPPITPGLTQVSATVTTANYYLVVDGSGSMAEVGCSDGRPKLDVAREALATFIDKLPPDANLGIYAFDKRGLGERLPLGPHSANRSAQVLDSLQAGGGTPLSRAILDGTQALTLQAQKQLGYGEYNLVVVTDGEASAGYRPDQAIHQLLESTPIVLHTVGFCIDRDHSLNQPGYTLYKAANDPASLSAGLDDVLSEAPSFDISSFGDKG